MNDRQEGSPDLTGALAVLASALAVVLVVVATITDRPVVLGAAAIPVAAAIALALVRRSTSQRQPGPTLGSAKGPVGDTDDQHKVGANPDHDDDAAERYVGANPDHDDDDGAADRYRGEAVTARADLLSTLRHGFRTGANASSDLDGSPTETPHERTAGPASGDAFTATGSQPPAPSAAGARRSQPDSFVDAPSATPQVPGSGAVAPDPLFDAATGLFTQGFFEASLPKRISAARRGLRPLSLAVVDVVVGRPVADAIPADRAIVAEAMIEVFRDADTVAIAHDNRFLILLEDTPEAGAVWTLERLRRHLTAEDPKHTLWAGVSSYPAYAFDADGLIAQARDALESARQWQQDRIEIAAHASE